MNPSLAAHFQVIITDTRIALLSVSALHDHVKGYPDADARQTVVLRRAVTQDKRLYNWYRDTRLGKRTAQTVTIVQLDSPNGKSINTWHLVDAQPVRWTGPHFNALEGELALEELEIRYDFINWEDR